MKEVETTNERLGDIVLMPDNGQFSTPIRVSGRVWKYIGEVVKLGGGVIPKSFDSENSLAFYKSFTVGMSKVIHEGNTPKDFPEFLRERLSNSARFATPTKLTQLSEKDQQDVTRLMGQFGAGQSFRISKAQANANESNVRLIPNPSYFYRQMPNYLESDCNKKPTGSLTVSRGLWDLICDYVPGTPIEFSIEDGRHLKIVFTQLLTKDASVVKSLTENERQQIWKIISFADFGFRVEAN